MSSLDLNRILTKLKRGCKLDPEKFIEKYLSHELPYDPVKAHEYYLRTRELKGRRSVSQLRGKSKKEGWLYTKNQIDEKHKLDETTLALTSFTILTRSALIDVDICFLFSLASFPTAFI